MIRGTIILYLIAFLCVVVGLWDHSWQLILAGTTLLVVWPIIQEEVTPHETHHNPDDGDGHGSPVGLGVPTDSQLLDNESGAESALRSDPRREA